MTDHSATQLRRRVLQLAAAHPADRDWVLGRLSPEQRRRVGSLLRQLDGLPVRDWSRLLPELDADGRQHDGSPTEKPSASVLPAVWSALLDAEAEAGRIELPFGQQVIVGMEAPGQPATEAVREAFRDGLPPAWSRALRDLQVAGTPP